MTASAVCILLVVLSLCSASLSPASVKTCDGNCDDSSATSEDSSSEATANEIQGLMKSVCDFNTTTIITPEEMTSERLIKLIENVQSLTDSAINQFDEHKADIVKLETHLHTTDLQGLVDTHASLLENFLILLSEAYKDIVCPFAHFGLLATGLDMIGDGFQDDLCDRAEREIIAYRVQFDNDQDAYAAMDRTKFLKLSNALRADMLCVTNDVEQLIFMVNDLHPYSGGNHELPMRQVFQAISAIGGMSHTLNLEWGSLMEVQRIIANYNEYFYHASKPQKLAEFKRQKLYGLVDTLRALKRTRS